MNTYEMSIQTVKSNLANNKDQATNYANYAKLEIKRLELLNQALAESTKDDVDITVVNGLIGQANIVSNILYTLYPSYNYAGTTVQVATSGYASSGVFNKSVRGNF